MTCQQAPPGQGRQRSSGVGPLLHASLVAFRLSGTPGMQVASLTLGGNTGCQTGAQLAVCVVGQKYQHVYYAVGHLVPATVMPHTPTPSHTHRHTRGRSVCTHPGMLWCLITSSSVVTQSTCLHALPHSPLTHRDGALSNEAAAATQPARTTTI